MTLAFWRSVGQAFCRMFLSWGLSAGSLVIGLGLRIWRQNPTGAVSLLITPCQDVRDDPHCKCPHPSPLGEAGAYPLPPPEDADSLFPCFGSWSLKQLMLDQVHLTGAQLYC